MNPASVGMVEPQAAVLRGVPPPMGHRALLRPTAVVSRATPGLRGDSAMSAEGPVAISAENNAEGHRDLQSDARDRAQSYQEGLDAGREEARQAGFDQGLQQGLAEGRSRGVQQAEREAEATRAAMARQVALLDLWTQSLKAQAAQQLAERLAAAEDDMVALCHAAVGRLLGTRFLAPEVVTHAVRRAIEECCGENLQTLSTVHVHPDDLALLQSDAALARWLSQRQAGEAVWRADTDVALGGCMVHSSQGTLDARLEIQLAALTQALLGHRQEGRTP
jgi:flagellar assembly protein FliH